MDQILHQTRILLNWPTSRKLVELTECFPNQEAWERAVESLRSADHPNEAYLIACLKTETGKLNERRKRESYREDHNCPYFSGLFCSGPPGRKTRDCRGEEDCIRAREHLPGFPNGWPH